ncbi:hypothetical protein AVEN_242173-1 [Araneus ventricosus]|uniref:Reverse transcriptase domain-containing protein n=1 Tax=Araneus ventricosus TaxID=182803 RepID=A0A4Y2DEB3_ARAVE|nr:hypothetical protein AVEN_242173-1 [Araneus ventricosus]
MLSKVTSQIPVENIDTKDLDYLKGVTLSDEGFSRQSECDIILGSDCFFTILRNGRIIGSAGQPIAQSTMFGWVVAGQIRKDSNSSSHTQSHLIRVENDSNIDSILQQFWQMEELPIKKSFLSEEEEFCETHFNSTYKINEQGRFVVKLPVYRDINQLGDTKGMAVSRLLAMENKFKFDSEFEKEYKGFMKEYKEAGHISLNKDSDSSKIEYFIPHHTVQKKDCITTKLRVVFDGLYKSPNSNSLNSVLGVGQVLQPDSFTILVRFRVNKIAFTADIKQMYRQILVHPEDQNLQKIVWRNSSDSPIKEYKLYIVTYGTSSAPFLATRCLHQLASDSQNKNPEISSIIRNSIYMDDLMAGATYNKEAIALIQKLSETLDARGFHLRKWRSNSQDVLNNLSENLGADESNVEIHPENCSKTLGLIWDSSTDSFVFKISFNFESEISKRLFLSQSASLFDSLSFLSPCTILIKIFYQQLWLLKLDWDNAVPEHFAIKWHKFQREFQQIYHISIPRWLQFTEKEITHHGFSDASESAYACIIFCLNTLKDHVINLYAWTDSQVVLSWLSSPPRSWKPFIANRTSEILDLIPWNKWCYVPTKENPTDIGSRGASPKDLPDCRLRWEGPTWLSSPEADWPKQPILKDSDQHVLKERKK